MPKNKSTATVLAFLGGIIGLHKFYLRDIGSGIFYVILTNIFINMFGFPFTIFFGIMDAMKLAGMSQEKFDQKYNKNAFGRGRRRERRNYPRSTRSSRSRTGSSRRRSSDSVSSPVNRTRRSQPRRLRNNPFKTSGYKKYKDFDLEDAIVDYTQALELSPEDKEIHFYMSAIYSLMEKKDKSFFHLDKAVSLGLKQTNKILEMDDFAFLRIQEGFEKFKNNGFRIVQQGEDGPDESLVMDDLLLSQLNKLKEMRDRGLLSEKEFLTEKEKIIRR